MVNPFLNSLAMSMGSHFLPDPVFTVVFTTKVVVASPRGPVTGHPVVDLLAVLADHLALTVTTLTLTPFHVTTPIRCLVGEAAVVAMTHVNTSGTADFQLRNLGPRSPT